MQNANRDIVDHFGREWTKFDQSQADQAELERQFERYFGLFPWEALPADAVGLDLGCGTGRWAAFVGPRVGKLHCIEPSDAIEVAKRHLADQPNVEFHEATMSSVPLPEGYADFAYCLGVLHVVPDPAAALAHSVRHLKPGAPFLVYTLYAFDNRPGWFRAAWKASDVIRRAVSSLPHPVRRGFAEVAAALVYFPLARLAAFAERRGRQVDGFPLAVYRDRSYYAMRTDALDRFGTRIEQRFTAQELRELMEGAGLTDVQVSTGRPYWASVGFKAP